MLSGIKAFSKGKLQDIGSEKVSLLQQTINLKQDPSILYIILFKLHSINFNQFVANKLN